jgi:hypothetical protein
LSEAFQRSGGQSCLSAADRGFDAVLVSDAGKKFQVSAPDRVGGILRTALRSSDILMDRVWQLEKEHFGGTVGFTFAPITHVVPMEDDPTALHPEVQIQVGRVRTDMDRFSDLEVSGLIRHGYCVARNACQTRPSAFGELASETPPWDPINGGGRFHSQSSAGTSWRGAGAADATADARRLRKSARRSYWSLGSAPKDWAAYLYVPILIALFFLLPHYGYKYYHRAHVARVLTTAVAETRADFSKLLTLLEYGPEAPFEPMEYLEVEQLDPLLGDAGLDIIADTRIVDLREWFEADEAVASKNRRLYSYRHVMIRKTAESKTPTGLRLQSLWDMPELTVRCLNAELNPVLCRCETAESPSSDGSYAWNLRLDFSNIPVGQTVQVVVEIILPYNSLKPEDRNRDWWRFEVDASPEVATSWILLPEGSQYANMSLVRYDNEQPGAEERIEPTHQAVVRGGSIINWSVVHPNLGYTYSCRWSWKM